MQHNRNTVNREQQGLQQMVRPSAGMDVNWAPTDRISFSTGYVHESNFQKQCGSVWNPLEPSLYWPSVSGTPIFLGIDQKNYWAQIVGVTLKYNSSRLVPRPANPAGKMGRPGSVAPRAEKLGPGRGP